VIGRRTVPAAVKALAPGERRLAWGVTDDGTALAATEAALWAGGARLAWAYVEKVQWQPPVLTVHEVSEIEGTGGARSWTLTDDHRLAETIRACVTSSIAWSDRRTVGPGAHVRLIGRRIAGRDQLHWQTVWEKPTDRAVPAYAAQAQEWVEELARTIG
jgi:hypothetical protein